MNKNVRLFIYNGFIFCKNIFLGQKQLSWSFGRNSYFVSFKKSYFNFPISFLNFIEKPSRANVIKRIFSENSIYIRLVDNKFNPFFPSSIQIDYKLFINTQYYFLDRKSYVNQVQLKLLDILYYRYLVYELHQG